MAQITIAYRKVSDSFEGPLPPIQKIKCNESQLDAILELIKTNDNFIYVHYWLDV